MHAHTPTLAVQDPRGLVVRTVQYWRQASEELLDVRITHQQHDAVGRALGSRDPRLFNLALAGDEGVPFNFIQRYSLSGLVLSTDSVDAGWRVALNGEAGQAVEAWDGRDGHTLMQYDELLRPQSALEQAAGGALQVSERFAYADAQAAGHNLCGQLVRHDDTAGTCRFQEYSMGGALLQQTRWFLNSIEPPDWPPTEVERDELLETGVGATTMADFNPLGETLSQTDAAGNIQRFSSTVAGELRQASVQLGGQVEQVLVSNLRYDALGNTQSETAGNGVVTARYYDAASGQLQRITAQKRDNTVLQDLNYRYDPSGNILRIENTAQTTKYFRNQAIEPVNVYVYDTLYQLIQATGYESVNPVTGPDLPPFQSPGVDPGQLANYTQRYAYDAAGNVQTLTHVGGQNYTREMITARYSNRSLPVVSDHRPDEAELAAGFDASGNLRALQPGQALVWDQRSQLRQVTPVVRDDGEDDYERYLYGGGGQRVRKVRMTQAASVSHCAEVRYLPGLEIRTNTATGETLHVISVSACRVLHWVEGKPEEVANDQLRYSLADHLGSSTTELDGQGNVISQESYYPFGGTACWAGRNAVEASYKTIRYSGKELDASGLYYYGFRYYAPWLARWINPDPAGAVDGLNLYVMVGNQPVNKVDSNGLVGELPAELEDLPKRVAKYLFSSGLALTQPVEEAARAQRWMDDLIKDKGKSRRKYGPLIWGAAQKDYFKHEKALLNISAGGTLTAELEKGIHIFWSTNAGAKYIRSMSTAVTLGSSPPQNLSAAHAGALGELQANLGDAGTIKLSHATKTKSFDPALELLNKLNGEPGHTIRLVKRSIKNRPEMSGVLYRGARIDDVSMYQEGAVLETSSFAAFSPDRSTAMSFLGGKFHHSSVMNNTQPVLFIVGGGAKQLHTSLSEDEGLFAPETKFKITTVVSKTTHREVFIDQLKLGVKGRHAWM
ncbi:RHS repeat-associated core domain-containing protein [Pseudomonas sp.]|uniref:RHS repeat-associated core domain-containing protein n=1 Tax=Pseudomonas sp. TaxID=306 RepID=UPI00261B9F3D|nr:RHS repeat-associated core domain-containing protein [Pseudomonas sp.]